MIISLNLTRSCAILPVLMIWLFLIPKMTAAWRLLVLVLMLLFAHGDSPQGVKGVLPELELPCRGPAGVTGVIILEWKRDTETVLFHRDNRTWSNDSEPFFYNRVELKDPDFKFGDLSVILKNVTEDDSGTYTCVARVNTTEGKKTVKNTVEISVTSGSVSVNQSAEDEQLQCLSPEGDTVQDLMWAKDRTDRKQTAILIRMKDGRVDYIDQDPSFTNRVKLPGPRLLVTTKDSRTYVCETRSINSAGIHKIHVYFFHLTVEQDMTFKIIVSVIVGLGALFVCSIIIGFCVYKCMKKSKKSQMEDGLRAKEQSDDVDAGGGRPGESRGGSGDCLLGPGLSSSIREESPFK